MSIPIVNVIVNRVTRIVRVTSVENITDEQVRTIQAILNTHHDNLLRAHPHHNGVPIFTAIQEIRGVLHHNAPNIAISYAAAQGQQRARQQQPRGLSHIAG